MSVEWNDEAWPKGGDHTLTVGFFKAKLYYATTGAYTWRVAFYLQGEQVKKLEGSPERVMDLGMAKTWARAEFKKWITEVADIAGLAARLLES